MKKLWLVMPIFVAILLWSSFENLVPAAVGQAAGPTAKPAAATTADKNQAALKLSPEEAALEAKKMALAAKEAALAAREQQMNAMASNLEIRTRELETAKKGIEASLDAEKRLQGERAKKTLKIYKSLKPAETARLLDQLDEKTATEIINNLDQRTVTKLIPYLNQPRVLKWTKETLAAK